MLCFLPVALSPPKQAGFMLKFIDQLEAVAANPDNPLHGKLDFTNMGAAGHSRGAKIAAMHFAGEGGNWHLVWSRSAATALTACTTGCNLSCSSLHAG